ncbi:NTP transferase domain-containing protein [Candidatus Gracilibacteria bacterium]|nr:NTP transferase domain-containing protein [Candidatus Gracilibacteria bacterium]MCF7856227.1 NTP transferase domain-containing protein [Candidatus Gracilibacteria bacterium]MCF7896708.1 NTP transferase domain-containing protein [Candidatus Gracilibacteria bacterium]
MQAILLAAGRSRRFQPLGDKNFFRLYECFLVEQQVAVLQKAGLKKIIIVANDNNFARLKKLFPKYEIVIQKNLDEGMCGGVLSAKKFLTSPTLITSTNDLVDASVVKKVCSTKNCDGAILAQKVEQYFPGGYLKVGGGKIFSIVEKPQPNKTPSKLVNIVFHFFQQPKLLVKELEKASNQNDDGYEKALGQLFKKQKFVAIENDKKWIALKFPWHVLDWMASSLEEQKARVSKKAKIAKTAIVENSTVEDGAKIFDYAIVKNSLIKKGGVVGTHSLVRDSIISKNAVVGSGSDVARSFIGENSWLHRNYVGDSILAENVSMGSGCVCANLRLDEEDVKTVVGEKKMSTQRDKFGCVIGKNSRVGVNTSLMPGVLVGENSFIVSGLVVEKNVVSQTFFTAEWKTKRVKNLKSPPARAKLN